MLEEVKSLQHDAVLHIISKLEEKDDITFKAPTGSGKTHMMAELMNMIIKQNQDALFVVSSLSKGDLAKQNFQKFEEYSVSEFTDLRPYLVSSEASSEEGVIIPEDYNVYVLPRDLYRDGAKIKDQGCFLNFLFRTSRKLLGRGRRDVILIKDECHIATNNLDVHRNAFHKVINFSATPRLRKGARPDVQISEMEAVNCGLIKKVCYGDDNDSVEAALNKLREVQEEYIRENFNMNPCLIIQISNRYKAEEEISYLLNTLNSKQYADLQWCLIVDKDKDCQTNNKVLKKLNVSKWKDELKTRTSPISIIIFKMVITEGWDIPRACLLYQVRNTKSPQLVEQVIGRVRRNPKLLEFDKLSAEARKVATTAYVWGKVSRNAESLFEIRLRGSRENNPIQQEFNIITTRLKAIQEINSFNVASLIAEQPMTSLSRNLSIFDIYRKSQSLKGETQRLFASYVNQVKDWFVFMQHADVIDQKVREIEVNYDLSMEIRKDEIGYPLNVSLPYKSCDMDSSHTSHKENWVWERVDGEIEFHFDSEAELKWLHVLSKLMRCQQPFVKKCIIDNRDTYLLGKNFIENSEIKFEYYLYGIHASYPDFVMKDLYGRIHLFEVKSLTHAHREGIDNGEYIQKIEALKKCYLHASKLVEYHFYIPILLDDEDWEVHHYCNGQHDAFCEMDFLDYMRRTPIP